MPTPIPAPNIMATQEKRENSGPSSSLPRRIRPNRDRPITSIATTDSPATAFSSHPVVVMAHENAAEDAAPTEAGELMPHTTKARTRTAVTPNTTGSTPKRCRFSSTPMPGTRPGWVPWG